jgi:site-specific recombinase XerD
MYGAALRVSEAMGLQLRDVDLQASTLLIRETKFYKTRWVPMGPRLRDEVANYLVKSTALPKQRVRSRPCCVREAVSVEQQATMRVEGVVFL